jgi:hypothetical protein
MSSGAATDRPIVDVVGEVLDEEVEPSPGKRLIGLSHDVHVLLRHGLCFRFEVAPPHALAVAPGDGAPERLVERHVANSAPTADVDGHDRRGAEVPHGDDLHGKVGEELDEVLPSEADPIVPAIGALEGDDARESLDVGIHEGQEGIEVAAVPRLVRPVKQRHVVRRHRPPVSPGMIPALPVARRVFPPVATKLTQSPCFLKPGKLRRTLRSPLLLTRPPAGCKPRRTG